MKKLLFILLFSIVFFNLKAQEESFPFLDIKAMGADVFLKQYPNYDGRGVVIFILDNSVDPLIPGLTKTSEGKTKVVDMQDFSNQVNLNLTKAEETERNGKKGLKVGDEILYGHDNLTLKPADGNYYVGTMNESLYKNSVVKDINSNGNENDKFAFLAFEVDGVKELLKDAPGLVKPQSDKIWVYYVDENLNNIIDDEVPRYDYKYNYDTFNFSGQDPSKLPLLTFSANVLSSSKIMVNTCDGSHGTHCAGIAAGYDIYGTKGNNGVAPGAYVVSLKIGSNVLSGGATTVEAMKKAYEYGVEFLKEAGFKYGVYSMSYGIGSEQPGKSEIEKFLNKFAIDNPNVVVVTSNGNEGPGVNSTGNPAGAKNIISVGAMIPPNVLQDLYGSGRTTNWVTHFSSRGGETSKPDVVAPGAASSTVPRYERGDRFWGTSMSCPQVAGAVALMLSAAIAENVELDGFMVKKALKATAIPLPGYTAVDYGNGLVNIPNAYKNLKLLSERKEYEKILDYDVTTTNTYYPNDKGYAAYWKSNGYHPNSNEKQAVTIKAIYPKDMPAEKKHDFYRVLDLKSDASWLKTDRSQIYIRGELAADFSLIYDHTKLKSPGIYVGRIAATAKNENNGGWQDTEIQATVIVPHKFGPENNYKLNLSGKSLKPGDIERVFVEVPPGATAMNVKMSKSGDKNYGMAMYIFSPDGNNQKFAQALEEWNDSDVIVSFDNEQLQEGIWEIIPYCFYQTRNESFYNLEVEFFGIQTKPEIVEEIEIEQGESPTLNLSFNNRYSTVVRPKLSGSINGYEKTTKYSEANVNHFTKQIKVGSDIDAVAFSIDMPDEEYNKVTDLAINIYDETGKAVFSSGMSRKYIDLGPRIGGEGVYTLELVPAFVTKDLSKKEWKFELIEKYYYKTKISLKPESDIKVSYPGVWYDLQFVASGSIPLAPNGTRNFGYISIQDNDTGYFLKKQKILLKN